MKLSGDLGHIWISSDTWDIAINYPPFYQRPYAMFSMNIREKRFAIWFGKFWIPHIIS